MDIDAMLSPTTNPFIDEHANISVIQKEIQRIHYKLEVVAVYKWNKGIKEELIDPIRTFCKNYRIEFFLREFYEGFEEDRECITAVPAFHLFYEDEYEMTFYPENDIFTILNTFIQKLKQEKRNTWGRFFATIAQQIPAIPTIPKLHLKRSRSSILRSVESINLK